MFLFLLLEELFPIFDQRSWLPQPWADELVLMDLPDSLLSGTKSDKSVCSTARKAARHGPYAL